MKISSENLAFLSALSENNEKDWFQAHKSDFEKYQEETKLFHQRLLQLMEQHDQIASGKVFRIYRDVRFSKDKTPYKNHWSGSFRRATHYLRGGYYYQIAPGNSYASGGFFGPNPQDLQHIRKQISHDPDSLFDVINSQPFKSHFGQLVGESVKTTPKGFSADDPAIEVLKLKQFIVRHHFKDEEVLSPDFTHQLNESFKAMRSYFDVMSMYLTTDLNGASLLD